MPTDTLPSHFTTEFNQNWISRIQQEKPRLAPFANYISVNGERKRFDRIGPASSQKRTTRKGATPVDSRATDSRWAYLDNYEIPAYMVDPSDASNLGVLTLPNSQVVIDNARQYNRDCDDLTWSTAIGSVKTGENGTTNTPFPSGQIIAEGNTGLTLAKLIEANRLFLAAEVDPMTPRVLVIGPKQVSDLLNINQLTSADYNTIRALVSGQPGTFMGFEFVVINRLPVASDIRQCVAMLKGSVSVIKGAMNTTIDRRPDLSNSVQIYSQYRLGATRIHDEGVIRIDCDETPD